MMTLFSLFSVSSVRTGKTKDCPLRRVKDGGLVRGKVSLSRDIYDRVTGYDECTLTISTVVRNPLRTAHQ